MAMKEYNIEALWNEDIAPEGQLSLGYLPGAIQSKLSVFGELKRVRNLFWWQWLMEFVSISLGVFLIFKSPDEITIIEIVLSLIYSGVVYFLYISYFIKFINGINKILALKIKEAIQTYYDVLCNYIKRIYKLFLVLLILSFIASLIEVLFEHDKSILGKIIYLVSMLIFMAFPYAALEGYFDYMYKDSKTEFETLLRELEDE